MYIGNEKFLENHILNQISGKYMDYKIGLFGFAADGNSGLKAKKNLLHNCCCFVFSKSNLNKKIKSFFFKRKLSYHC